MKEIDLKLLARISILQSNLDNVYFTKNTGFSAVRLLFLKYATDNFIGAVTKEDVQKYANVQKMFAARDVESGPEVILPILEIVDKYYNLDGILRESIAEYAKELFGLDNSWNKKTATVSAFKGIMEELSKIDFTEELNSKAKGKMLVKHLLTGMHLYSGTNRAISQFISKPDIGELAKRILNIKSEDTFLDFASGCGVTTIALADQEDCRIINLDRNRTCLCVSAMLYILYGYTKFELHCEDSFATSSSVYLADKIFTDPPIGMKILDTETGANTDSTVAAMKIAIRSLNETGLAVIAVPSGFLFGSSKLQVSIKKEIVQNSSLSAVISLPISWYGTGVTINLIVLSKQKVERTLFINATTKEFSQYLLKAKSKETTISDEGIQKIIDTINNQTEKIGFSSFATFDEIVEKNFNFLPTTYVKAIIEEDVISLQEIDSKLEALYKKLSM